MPIISHEGRLLLVRLELDASRVPALLEAHQKQWSNPDPNDLEARAAELEQADFPPHECHKFFRTAIGWGRGHRFLGRASAKNRPETVARALRDAVHSVDQGDPAEAVTRVQKLSYIGQSFASKLVRFLRPEQAVILDSVLRTNLGYAETKEGYATFIDDCRAIQRHLSDAGNALRLCDVEAAVFAQIQGYV